MAPALGMHTRRGAGLDDMHASQSCADAAAAPPRFECHLCGGAATQACGSCGALFYCGDAHRTAHWAAGGHGGAECARMAADVAARDALREASPFPWAAPATAELEAQRATACAFLEAHGVHGVGMWRRECACGAAGPFGLLSPRGLAADARDALWALPRGNAPGAVPSEHADARDAPLPHDWASYYALRRLPVASLASLCLDAALTLVHALALTNTPLPRDGQTLTVHLLGPRRELDQLPALLEAAAALPAQGGSLHVIMVGPDVPSLLCGASFGPTVPPGAPASACSLRVTLRRAAAYDGAVAAALPPAALVFAPNAGVAAYPTEWRATAAALAAPGAPPLCITDYTAEAARVAARLLAAAGMEVASDGVTLNPFRRPLGCPTPAAALPAYSNGWLVLLRARATQSER